MSVAGELRDVTRLGGTIRPAGEFSLPNRRVHASLLVYIKKR
jgi:hypothetical protein